MIRLAGVCAALCCAGLSAQTIRITGGATRNQVFQRDANGVARIEIAGAVSGATGRFVEARITQRFLALEGFSWKLAGKIANGKLLAILEEVPAGGPYDIELRIPGTRAEASIHDVLVGDLWLLAGQSNMEGNGNLSGVDPPDALVHNFDQMDQWLIAEEPLHNLRGALDRVHWLRTGDGKPLRFEGAALMKYNAERVKGAGPGLPFAIEMVRRTSIPIGLLPCAHGGTSMDQWDPALREKGGDSLYGSMYRRFRAAGGRIAGMLWYQGESEANPEAAPAFQAKFERFVAKVRQDFKQPDLPFYYVQIGRHVSLANQKEWNVVQEAQRKAESTIPHAAMAVSLDLSLDDGIHIGTQDQKRLGQRLAKLATGGKRGPRPVSAKLEGNVLRVNFSDVNGALHAAGRVSGFSIHAPDGSYLPAIFNARVDPRDGSAVLLSIEGKLPEGAVVHYGFGKDPYCNLVDSEDMALPAFGPLPL